MSPTYPTPTPVELEIAGGRARGSAQHGVARFLGLPYAAPPFGVHRLRPPAPVVPWDGVRDATAYGPTVPKGEYPELLRPLLPEPSIAGEECLNLNVWTPADALGTGSLPVLVWLHGGGFTNGSGAVAAYDGSAFARDGVVCVTLNHRLGAEGFLFTEGDRGTTSANLGLQDQVAALHWVQEHIARFGGDLGRVTLAGESAGAMSITALLAMPSADGLFHRVIAQSGTAVQTLPAELGLDVARLLAERLGVPATREAIAAVDVETLTAAAHALVLEAQAEPDPELWGELAPRILPLSPVVDGTVLPEHPDLAAARGRHRDVAMLAGSNREEARLFLVPSGRIREVDDAAFAAGAAAYDLSPGAVEVYRRARPGDTAGDRLAQVIGDWQFRQPAIQMAETRERAGARTWMYEFDRPRREDNGGLGSAHAAELPFVFDTLADPGVTGLAGPAPAQAVADTTHATWVRFATTGDPGWAPYTSAARTTGVITESVEAVDDPRRDERTAWSR